MRPAQPIDATRDGKTHNFPTMRDAIQFTGITRPRILEAIETGEPVTAKLSGQVWTFARGSAEAAPKPPTRTNKPSAALVKAPAERVGVKLAGDVPVVPGSGPGLVLAAIAGMANAIGSVTLTDVEISPDGGLRVGKVEVARAG